MPLTIAHAGLADDGGLKTGAVGDGHTCRSRQTYHEALVIAREAKVVPDVLQALAGLAALQVHEQNYETALALAVHVEQNAASRTETRNHVAQLRAAIAPPLVQQQIHLEERAEERLLEDIVIALLTAR